jgi:hypothetical protein
MVMTLMRDHGENHRTQTPMLEGSSVPGVKNPKRRGGLPHKEQEGTGGARRQGAVDKEIATLSYLILPV